MFRLRTTATVSLLVLIGATGMSLWMSAWPRMHDQATEAAVAARDQDSSGGAAKAAATRPRRERSRQPVHAVVKPARAQPSPPTPVFMPSPSYPIEALREQRGGVVTLRVSVDGSGRVTAVGVARSSGDPALDASARKTMRSWRFNAPADGQPTSFDYPVRFRISTAAVR